MSAPVKTIFIELRASADRLKSDMADAGTALDRVGTAGQAAGSKIAGGVTVASESFGKLARDAGEAAVIVEGLLVAAAKYSGVAAASAGNTETLVNSYRGLRIALDPSIFTVASVAIGVLAEQTIRLTLARAKLIEQQSLIAAKGGLSVGSVEKSDLQASISGGGANASTIRSLQSALQSRSITAGGSVSSGLGMLGVSGSADDPDILAKIAAGFASIEDPAKRAEAAVRLFGEGLSGTALEQLNQRFAMGAAAVNQYGLALNATARTQIYQFRHDIESLKNPFVYLAEQVRASGDEMKSSLEQMAAAAWDMSGRANEAIGNLLLKIPGLQALAGALRSINPRTLSPDELKAGIRNNPDVQSGMQADDMFAIAQAAKQRASQTLEGLQAQQSAAQSRADAAYSTLDTDRKKRQADPHDTSLLTGDQRLSLAAQQQSASQLAIALGGKVTAMQEALDAQKQAEALAKQLADFQAGAAGRLNSLYQSATEQSIRDPLARQMFEGRLEVQRDADRTTPAEKQGRAQIVTGQLQAAAQAELLKNAQAVLAENAKESSARLAAFGKELQKSTDDLVKKAEGQRRIDAVEMEGARSGGEHATRMAGIQSQPGDEAQLAKDVLAIRLQTVATERAILDAHRESYTVVDGQAADDRINNEEAAAYLAHSEQIAARQKDLQQSALQTGGAYQQHLLLIQQQFDALNSIAVTNKNVLDIETARIGLNRQLLEAQIAQAQATGQNAGGMQFQLAQQNAQAQLRQWNSASAGTAGADVINALMQLPQEISSSFVSSIFDAPKRGQTKEQEILGGLKKTGENAGKQLAAQLLTTGIEKLIATIIPQAAQSATLTSSMVALNASVIANTAAHSASTGIGAAGSAAGAASSVAGTAGSAASSAASGLVGPLISAAGGIIGGIISGVMSMIGDNKIVKAVDGTTAAVLSLKGNFGTATSTPNGLTSTSSSTTSPSAGGFLSGLMTRLTGSGAVDVNVVSISPIALGAGLFHLFGFDEGGPVSHDMVAKVHKGEHVLNADQVAGRAPLPGFLRGAQFPSTEDYMSTGGSTVAPRDGDVFGGNHTFHIYETSNARETAAQIKRHLTTMLPSLSKYAR